MRESILLNHIYERSSTLAQRFGQVVTGPGDDSAVVRTASGELLLATTDQIISGRHFRPGTPVDRIARKLIARSVSDIAAMGGRPSWALATGALPSDYDAADQLFDAMARWGERFGCPLVGGDIATLDGNGHRNGGSRPQVTVGGQKVVPSFVGKMVLTCTVVGTPHPARGPVLRSTLRTGDEIWVSGRLGGSLHSGRHLAFTPRLREAWWLCEYLGADLHAMMDISDGLGRDTARLAAASGVGAAIHEDRLPFHEDVHSWQQAVQDGEDYELVFGIEPGALGSSGEFIARDGGTRLTRIGHAAPLPPGGAPACMLLTRDGRAVDISDHGWDHGTDAPPAA